MPLKILDTMYVFECNLRNFLSHCGLYMLPTVSTVSPSATWKMKLAYQSNYFVEHTGLKIFESSILIFMHLQKFLKICFDFFVIYLLHKNPCQNSELYEKYEFVFENYFTTLWYFVELMSKNRIVCHKIIIIERKEKVYAYANEAINSKSRFFTFSTAILSTPLAYQGLHCTLLYIQV